MQRGGLAAQVAESLLDAEGLLEQPPRLGRVALVTLDARQRVQRDGLALQVAESLRDAEGLLEQPPCLGRVALGTLDDRQLVQRGGLAGRSPSRSVMPRDCWSSRRASAGLPWSLSIIASWCSEAAWPRGRRVAP